jgi:hypothetical protein
MTLYNAALNMVPSGWIAMLSCILPGSLVTS